MNMRSMSIFCLALLMTTSTYASEEETINAQELPLYHFACEKGTACITERINKVIDAFNNAQIDQFSELKEHICHVCCSLKTAQPSPTELRKLKRAVARAIWAINKQESAPGRTDSALLQELKEFNQSLLALIAHNREVSINNPWHELTDSIEEYLEQNISTDNIGGPLLGLAAISYILTDDRELSSLSLPILFASLYGINLIVKEYDELTAPVAVDPEPRNFTIDGTLTSTLNDAPKAVFVFSHGLTRQGPEQRDFYLKEPLYGTPTLNEQGHFIMDGITATFDYPDADNGFDREKTNLGQDTDIECLKRAIDKVQADPRTTGLPIVLVGVSRGAATIIDYLAQYGGDHIAAAVIESPFARASDVIVDKLTELNLEWIPGLVPASVKIGEMIFPHHDVDGIHPIDKIALIPSSIPLMMVLSKEDEVIHYSQIRELYSSVAERDNVFLLEVEQGQHGDILWEEDGQMFQDVVHAFYAHYNIPHCPDCAARAPELSALQAN